MCKCTPRCIYLYKEAVSNACNRSTKSTKKQPSKSLKLALLFGSVVLVSCRTVILEKASLSLTEESEALDSQAQSILESFLDRFDVTSGVELSPFLQGCSKGKCQFCKKALGHEACFVATSEKLSIDLEVTLDGKQVMKTDINVPNPPKICKKKIPGLKMISDVCVQLKKVDLKNASGCVYVSFKVYMKKLSFKVQCFKIPTSNDEIVESDNIEVIQDGDVHEFEPTDSNA